MRKEKAGWLIYSSFNFISPRIKKEEKSLRKRVEYDVHFIFYYFIFKEAEMSRIEFILFFKYRLNWYREKGRIGIGLGVGRMGWDKLYVHDI